MTSSQGTGAPVSNKWARILYRPIGLASSVIGGVVAGVIFKQGWKIASPGNREDAPQALDTDSSLTEILIAAAVQGAVFALVKALIDRGGAKVFKKFTGGWPGD